MADYTLGFTGAAIDAALAYANNGAMKVFANIDQTAAGHPVGQSYNVTSTTDDAAGRTILTFTNVFSAADYCPINGLNGDISQGTTQRGGSGGPTGALFSKLTTAYSSEVINQQNGARTDCNEVNLGIVGGLA
jgi:hypothetical protein